MAKIENRKKQNPKLQQSELSDGRASLYLEYYIGRTETPVLDENGEQVFYTEGAMAGKPKFKIKHTRKKENLNLYIFCSAQIQFRAGYRNTEARRQKDVKKKDRGHTVNPVCFLPYKMKNAPQVCCLATRLRSLLPLRV